MLPITESSNRIHPVQIRRGKRIETISAVEVAGQFAEYAVLCANIYQDLSPAGPAHRIPLPDAWQMWAKENLLPVPVPPISRRRFVDGLGYEIWDYQQDANAVKSVIVFRGTDFKQLGDWIANLRWLTLNLGGRWVLENFFWDQYHQVQALTPQLIAAIKKRHEGKQVKVITTGHSLGGGLAQQAAYCCSDIKQVIAFNPSPVTGYMDVPVKSRDVNRKGVSIARVYQQGEVLAYLRSVLRRFYPLTQQDPVIDEYQVNFIEGNLINRHGIHHMAEHLLKLANISRSN